MIHTPDSVLDFWFGDDDDPAAVAEARSSLWWGKDEATDAELGRRYEPLLHAVVVGELVDWLARPHGRLAAIILADQIPRAIYRGTARAFSYDRLALEWSLAGLAAGTDRTLRPIERVFQYLPLEHAEDLGHQERSVQLFEALAAEVPEAHGELFAGYLDFARRHRDIIARFGRFPHRNAVLGRTSSAEELAFLEQPGSSF